MEEKDRWKPKSGELIYIGKQSSVKSTSGVVDRVNNIVGPVDVQPSEIISRD